MLLAAQQMISTGKFVPISIFVVADSRKNQQTHIQIYHISEYFFKECLMRMAKNYKFKCILYNKKNLLSKSFVSY